MGISDNLKNSFGGVAKAQLLLVQKEASSPAGGFGDMVGQAAALTDIGNALGGKILTVQFNPSSVSIYAHNEPVYIKSARTQTESELPQQQMISAGTTMSVDLIFDDTNISDAFNIGNGLNTSATNLIKTGINMLSNKVHSVRKYVEAFVATAVDPKYGNLIFEWGTFRFTGVMNELNARYTMFNPKGEPIRATVSLTLVHTPSSETEKLDAKDFDNLFKLTQVEMPAITMDAAFPTEESIPPVTPPSTDKFEKLKTDYGNFEAPKAQVTVGGMTFNGEDKKTKELFVNNISVELTSGYEASIATFSIYNMFDVLNGVFDISKIKNAICLGNPVSISLGYAPLIKPVFTGFVSEVNFVSNSEEATAVRITAMDAKGAMMANRYSRQLTAKYYSDAVKEILDKPVYGSVISEYKIDASPDGGKAASKGGAPSVPPVPTAGNEDKTKTIEMVDESDYEFILKAAKKFGYDFYISNGQVIYRKPKSSTQTLLSLKIGKGLTGVDLGYSMIGITNFVEARSTDAGKASGILKKLPVGVKFPYGSAGTKLIKNSKKVYIDPTIMSAEDANLRAQSLVEDMKYRFIQVECDCVGLPDILPGDFIELTLIKGSVTKCYITEVKQTMSTDDGYHVVFRAKADKISDDTNATSKFK